MRTAQSGQFIYFTLVSALSGNPVTGASGSISGRKSIDGLSGMIVLSGNIIELGGGSYRANLYDWDCSGLQAGYLFTASGCVPVQYQFDMIDGNASGAIWLASGLNVRVYSGQLSGQLVTPASGAFVTADLLSGRNVLVYSGQLSGQLVNLLSGNQVQVWSGTFVNVFSGSLSGQLVTAASGVNVVADVARWRNVVPNNLLASGRLDAAFSVRTNVAVSGTANTIQLDAGAPTGTSGIYDGQLITIVGGSGAGETRRIVFYSASGIATVAPSFTVAPFADSIFTITPGPNPTSGLTYIASGPNVVASLLSGQSVLVYSGQLSGQPVTTFDINTATTSGKLQIASGPFVVATATVGSGVLYLASGSIFRETFASGVIAGSGGLATSWGNSGAVTVGQNLDKSGYFVGGILSGITQIASGPFVVATATVGSGTLYLASGSIFRETFASGVVAGSGGLATSWGNSGAASVGQNLDKSGYFVGGILSGITQIASGPFVVATATIGSGTLYLASGSIFRNTFASGALGASGGISLAWGNSGSVVTALNQDKSGYTAGLISGVDFIASGHYAVASLLSGQSVNVYSGQLSGQLVTAASGLLNLASGSILSTTYASGVLNTLIPQNILTWNYSGAPNVSGQRNLLNATRKLINRWTTQITSGFLTVYQEDDSTLAYDQAIGSVSGANPIVSLDTR